MFNTIYYWDATSDNGMIEVDLEKGTIPSLDDIKKVHAIYKKGYVEKETLDEVTFNNLMEHITASAYRHYLIKRKPYILIKLRYEKLTDFEIKCIYEFIMADDVYKDAVKHKDIILPIKLGWWNLKDIMKQYTDIVKLGLDTYSFEGDNKW